MSGNPLRERLLTNVEYFGLLAGARPPQEELDEPQNVFEAVYRVLPYRQPMAPMPFPDAPPTYPNPALPPRGLGGGWGQ